MTPEPENPGQAIAGLCRRCGKPAASGCRECLPCSASYPNGGRSPGPDHQFFPVREPVGRPETARAVVRVLVLDKEGS
jgi:hypothetical protein